MIGAGLPGASPLLRELRVDCPRRNILARLQYRRVKSRLEGASGVRIERTIEEAFWSCEPRGLLRTGRVEPTDDGVRLVFGEAEYFWKSLRIRDFFRDSTHVGVLAATVGPECETARESFQTRGDLFSAVIYDAVGSETADEAINALDRDLRHLAVSVGARVVTRRFSSGYGDLDLETQRDIDEILGLGKIGVRVSDRFILNPEKSVTAVMGIAVAQPSRDA